MTTPIKAALDAVRALLSDEIDDNSLDVIIASLDQIEQHIEKMRVCIVDLSKELAAYGEEYGGMTPHVIHHHADIIKDCKR